VNRVLVTGASGFVGRALVQSLGATYRVRAAARQPNSVPSGANIEPVALPDLMHDCDFSPLVAQADAVVHLAGIAHAGSGIPDSDYDRVNRGATAELARAAATAGVARFVFVSSIRAQSGPTSDHVLDETCVPQPTDAYGRSKLAAEREVIISGVPYTILRPTLVYGPGAKGNFSTLMRLAAMPLPLPFGAMSNRRSLLAIGNLVAAIRHVLTRPATAGQTYVVADTAPISLAEIVATLRTTGGRNPNLFSVPPALVKAGLALIGRNDIWHRLAGELVVDPSRLMATGWRPSVATPDGLAAMVQAALPRKSGTAERSTP
jgi:nucleoside-diphosphate-sugar epimerase